MDHLLSIAIGPVQAFIAAALRTRDLWFGSHLLSELSRAAAEALQAQGAQLIFPAPGFKPSDNIGNRLLAQFSGDETAADSALEAAKRAARDRFDTFVTDAEERYDSLVGAKKHPLRQEQWQAQRSDLLELYACRVPLNGDYDQARRRLDTLNAARKGCRDFPQTTLDPQGPGYGIPKSSLDGERESVLPETLPDAARLKLRLGQGEQLDLPGLVKRLAGGKADQFTSVVRIALDPWLRPIDQRHLDAINRALEPLVAQGLVTRVKGNQGIYASLPFDGDLLYPERLRLARREAPDNPHLEALQKALTPLWRAHGEPPSYYALLLADGDHMGRLLDKATSADQHRAISQALADFAGGVAQRVRDHRGHCIYAGGDDVLALLPLDQALACADGLQRAFNRALEGPAAQLSVAAPTLSVGLVAAHRLTPLGRVRELAAQAERYAKSSLHPDTHQPQGDERNALALTLSPRAGAPLHWRDNWTADPVTRLQGWQGHFAADRLPDGLPYELRQIGRKLQGSAKFDELFALELGLVLNRKHTQGGSTPIDPALIQELVEGARQQGTDGLIQSLLAARWLAQQTPPGGTP